jgi:hypothetical protein
VTEESDRPEDDDVRRLLAEARHTGPMPDDVAARLDAVLADLAGTSGDRSAGADPQVASLAAHRRRRAAGLLVAAAAIVVGGVAVAQQLPQRHDSPAATAGGAPTDSSQAKPGNTGNGKVRSPGALSPNVGTVHLKHGRIVVHAQRFSADALAGRALMKSKATYSAHSDIAGRSCVVAPAHSRLLKAVFRHAPAVLVYHRPAGSTQVVDLFVCGTTQPLRSVTLPTD